MKFRLLLADEIDCKIKQVSQKGVLILLYKDARCDMNILDETVGAENWQRKHELINGNLFCSVGIFCPQINQWVWKQDVGTESMTEKEKGEASDSFKRACFNWGIGRELYTAPFMWVSPNNLTTLKQDDKGKWVCYDKFMVTDITYNGRMIGAVEIQNVKAGSRVVFSNAPEIAYKHISTQTASALAKRLQDANVNIEALMNQYNVNKLEDLNEKQHSDIIQRLNRGK